MKREEGREEVKEVLGMDRVCLLYTMIVFIQNQKL